jgi:TGS domain
MSLKDLGRHTDCQPDLDLTRLKGAPTTEQIEALLAASIGNMGKEKKEKKDKKGKDPLIATVHATARYSVLDYPGESQPVTTIAVASTSVPGEVASSGGAQGRRAKAGSGPKIAQTGIRIGGDSFLGRAPNPEWLKQRVAVYESVKERRNAELATKVPTDITVTMPDGKVIEKDSAGKPLQAWVSTPYDVAVTISQGLADSATVARVTYASLAADYSLHEDGMDGDDMLSDAMADGGIDNDSSGAEKAVLWDMMRPLVGPVAKLEFLKFEQDSAAKTVFWHSSAHMMGEALEHLYGNKLTIGPPLAGGFYYDSYMGSDTLKEDDCTLQGMAAWLPFQTSMCSFNFALFQMLPWKHT